MTTKPATCGDCVNRGYIYQSEVSHSDEKGIYPTKKVYECRISCAKITYDDPACVNFKRDGVWVLDKSTENYPEYMPWVKKDEQEREQE